MADIEEQPLTKAQGPNSGPPPEPKSGGSSFSLVLKIVAAVVVLIGLTMVLFWAVVNPRKMKFHVTEAWLNQFELANDNTTLYYNLRLNVAVRNPNKKIGFHYDVVKADAYYEGEYFDSGNMVSFYQPPKTTTAVDAWFSGQRKVSFGSDEVEEFLERKTSSGVYSVDVKIHFYTSIKLGKMNIGDFKVKAKCGFKVPLSSVNGIISSKTTTTAVFVATKCDVDFNPRIVISSD